MDVSDRVNSHTRWVVYGYRSVSARATAAVHADGLETLAAARLFLMEVYLKYGQVVHAVIVQLDYGTDTNGARHVVARVGDGKAWWE